MIGGYEPKSADAFYQRTAREFARFGDTWQLQTETGPLLHSDDKLVATVLMKTTAENWAVKTTFNFFVWNTLVLGDFSRPLPVRLWRYLVTFFDYFFTGTAFSFVRTNWRFALYFLYPAIMLTIFGAFSIFIANQTQLINDPYNLIATLLFALVMFWLLIKTIGQRWFVLHLMDLWSFSRYYLRGKRPDSEALIARYSRAVVDCAAGGEFDEILLVGHSTGGALILDIAATALSKNPQLAAGKTKITILTVGSTALKIGLHPAAQDFRSKVQTLVDCQKINWVEYQSHTDIINFYKTNPVKEMRLASNRSGEFPLIRRVRIRDMLKKDIYARIKRNFFRVHYQFIMANTKPYHYDFFMICCGPLFLVARVLDQTVGPLVDKNTNLP